MAGRKYLDAETVRDLWEVELELEISGPTGPSLEGRLADPSMLLAWNRPFRDVDEMNRHLLGNGAGACAAKGRSFCLGGRGTP